MNTHSASSLSEGSRLGPHRSGGVRRLGWLSLFAGTCAVAGGIYAVTGQGIPCPFLEATGWLCPFCGGSRMGVALLRGNPVAAWNWNPFVLVLGALLLFVWCWTAIRILLRRPVRLPGALRVIDGLNPSWMVSGLVALGFAFMVLRNLL